MKGLHHEKSSPDGLSAEMFRQLSDEELVRMAAAIHETFEASWTVLHGFVDSEESRHESFARHASNFLFVPLSQAVGLHLDGCSPAFTVDGSSVWICA